MNQDVQRKLQAEVDKYFPIDSDDEPEYDNVMKMEYLDMVWCETLRKYPLASTYVSLFISSIRSRIKTKVFLYRRC